MGTAFHCSGAGPSQGTPSGLAQPLGPLALTSLKEGVPMGHDSRTPAESLTGPPRGLSGETVLLDQDEVHQLRLHLHHLDADDLQALDATAATLPPLTRGQWDNVAAALGVAVRDDRQTVD